jgi:hypothetical protein
MIYERKPGKWQMIKRRLINGFLIIIVVRKTCFKNEQKNPPNSV